MLPPGLLASIAAKRGIVLCLDYDGTLAELNSVAANAQPVGGVRSSIKQIAHASKHAAVAIVTGRRADDIERLLGIDTGIAISGLHGLELRDVQGRRHIDPEVTGCASELGRVKEWLARNVPQGRGFLVEDKSGVLGLHYRHADSVEAEELCGRFSEFVLSMRRIKLVRLTMLLEAMPRCASKARAIASFKAQAPKGFSAIYFGDEVADEEAFAALDKSDLGILVGNQRMSHAKYRVSGPHAVAAELSELATSLARRSSISGISAPTATGCRSRAKNSCRLARRLTR